MIQNKYSILSFDSFENSDVAIKILQDWQVINNKKAKFDNEILTRLNPNNSFWTLSLSADGWWPLPMMNLSILAFFSSMMGCCCFFDTFHFTKFWKSVSSKCSNQTFGIANCTFEKSHFSTFFSSLSRLWGPLLLRSLAASALLKNF